MFSFISLYSVLWFFRRSVSFRISLVSSSFPDSSSSELVPQLVLVLMSIFLFRWMVSLAAHFLLLLTNQRCEKVNSSCFPRKAKFKASSALPTDSWTGFDCSKSIIIKQFESAFVSWKLEVPAKIPCSETSHQFTVLALFPKPLPTHPWIGANRKCQDGWYIPYYTSCVIRLSSCLTITPKSLFMNWSLKMSWNLGNVKLWWDMFLDFLNYFLSCRCIMIKWLHLIRYQTLFRKWCRNFWNLGYLKVSALLPIILSARCCLRWRRPCLSSKFYLVPSSLPGCCKNWSNLEWNECRVNCYWNEALSRGKWSKSHLH